MKIAMNVLLIILATITFASCEKTMNPVTPDSSIDKTTQSYTGGFEVVYKDYQNTSRSVTLSGSINFNFNQGSYSYTGVLSTADAKVNTTEIHDNGTYTIRGNQIEMHDDATKRMNPQWLPSLYLSGVYSYRQSDTQVIIEGSGDFGSVRIVLSAQ